MSARVAWGQIAPAGKPHPTAKWSLLMVLLAVVVLGVPGRVGAASPSVQSPQGAMSGGVFTGTYTFDTYISCSGGFSFSSSYANSLDGTHSFAFWGAADGSLLVSIDSGGLQLVTSCGDPFTGPNANVANYTVSKNTAPPPTPTPSAAPTPTPTAAPSGGGGAVGGSGGSPTGNTSGTHGAAPANQPKPAAPAPTSPSVASPIAESSQPASHASSSTPTLRSKVLSSPHSQQHSTSKFAGLWLTFATASGVLCFLILILLGFKSRRVREALHRAWRHAALKAEPYAFRLRYYLHRRPKVHAREEAKRPGLSYHHHTGKLIAHHHTSYPALTFLLLLSGLLSAGVSLSSQADSSLLSVTVLGPPPAQGATIDAPANGDHTSVSTQTVRGTCPQGLMVEVYRNATFAGSSLCDGGGLYNLVISLVPGQNDLIARDLDALNQYGPDSGLVTIFYDPPAPAPTPSPSPASGAPKSTTTPTLKRVPTPAPAASVAPAPFYLTTTSHFFQGNDPSVAATWDIHIIGGRGPYLANWEWGDGAQDTPLASSLTTITNSHLYAKPATYHVTVRVMDANAQEAVISLVAIISGPTTGGTTSGPLEKGGNMIVIWPLLIMTGLMVFSFWLGERHKVSQRRLEAV